MDAPAPPKPTMPTFDAPPISIRWPRMEPVVPDLGLTMLGEEQRTRMRALLPLDGIPESPTAAATFLMTWVSGQWTHNGWNDPGTTDPVAILERGIAGEQFRCVEYGIVLAGALAAMSIPSRPVSLRQPRYWEPLSGKGHVGMEAWLDDLGRWVYLDAQLGGWWEESGQILNVAELVARHRSGEDPCAFTGDFGEIGSEWLAATGHADARAYWWDCFAHVSVGGNFLLGGDTYNATFQQMCASRANSALHADQHAWAYPDLGALSVRCPAEPHGTLCIETAHPYATGFRVGGDEIARSDATLDLLRGEGDHAVDAAVATDWGSLRPTRIEWNVGPLMEPLDPPYE